MQKLVRQEKINEKICSTWIFGLTAMRIFTGKKKEKGTSQQTRKTEHKNTRRKKSHRELRLQTFRFLAFFSPFPP